MPQKAFDFAIVCGGTAGCAPSPTPTEKAADVILGNTPLAPEYPAAPARVGAQPPVAHAAGAASADG
jgi:hypothetical protein